MVATMVTTMAFNAGVNIGEPRQLDFSKLFRRKSATQDANVLKIPQIET